MIRFTQIVRLSGYYDLIMTSMVARLTNNVKIHITKNIKFLTSLIGTFFLVLHVLACGFIRVGHYNDGYTDGWIILKRIEFEEAGFSRSMSLWLLYFDAIYFMTTSATTVGYGDMFATSFWERMFVCLCEFMGICIYSIVYNGITR